jgi:hypothetical protein
MSGASVSNSFQVAIDLSSLKKPIFAISSLMSSGNYVALDSEVISRYSAEHGRKSYQRKAAGRSAVDYAV